MALADGGEAKYVFHVATGAAATPSDVGGFTFYRKDPGFNAIGMYYSVYYNRGEATHGYHSVPPYPASHGCIRNPIPDSIFIYNWIDFGQQDVRGQLSGARDTLIRRVARARAGRRGGDALQRTDGRVLRRCTARAAATGGVSGRR